MNRIINLIAVIILTSCLILQIVDIFYDMPLIQHSGIGISSCIIAIFLNMFGAFEN